MPPSTLHTSSFLHPRRALQVRALTLLHVVFSKSVNELVDEPKSLLVSKLRPIGENEAADLEVSR